MVLKKNVISLSNIEIPVVSLLSALHTDMNNESIDDILRMHKEAAEIAKPAAVYACFTPVVLGSAVSINGVLIEDRFVHEMLAGQETVVPYAATCGTEIDKWAETFTDFYEQYIADVIKAMCLTEIQEKLFDEVKASCFGNDDKISSINPGSLQEWPITGQEQLFGILGGVTGDIRVRLTDSCLMIPNKSISGIFFRSEEGFHNCQLCPRDDCPNRKAPQQTS